MKVYKFGGASVKDSEGVKNLARILKKENEAIVVISAMDKTTKAFEKVVNLYVSNSNGIKDYLHSIFQYHRSISNELFENESHEIFSIIRELENSLTTFLSINKSPKRAFIYDQVVNYGELLSTSITSNYLNHMGIINTLVDSRNIIKTDSKYREANVNWDATIENVKNNISPNTITIAQGFIGSDDNNFTTTLGLEGSDYSAAIFAYCINAESVTVWKDVDGILNADPRFFKNTTLLNHISFREAIELSYYGASVIHPKTIQPLQHKEIPLYVKNFYKDEAEGTVIKKGTTMDPITPCYILKENQILLSISALDFSFIVEENISEIFALISKFKINVNMIQNSAISFSLILEDKFILFDDFLDSLKSKYRIKYNVDVKLYTIRHYNDNNISTFEEGKTILLKQFSRETAQYIIK
ncbi:MAG: aspartate kinase [Flavobacteriales bacterium]|nr:aspartate kinase [Flavobacteriales bacterium]